MTEHDGISAGNEYPPAALRIADPALVPLEEIVAIAEDGRKPAAHWYGGGGRSLFAEALHGRWCRMEYVFPLGPRLFELRWADGKGTRLWSVDRELHERDPGSTQDLLRTSELNFPAAEIQQMELVMHGVPHSLWSRLIKLALDAHFMEAPFPQRAAERRPERRSAPRAHG